MPFDPNLFLSTLGSNILGAQQNQQTQVTTQSVQSQCMLWGVGGLVLGMVLVKMIK